MKSSQTITFLFFAETNNPESSSGRTDDSGSSNSGSNPFSGIFKN